MRLLRHSLRRVLTPGGALCTGALLLIVVLSLELVKSRDYIFLPDRAHPVAPLVRVAGGHDAENGGGIYFVDVVVRRATLLEQIFGGLHNGADLYAPKDVLPAGVSGAQEAEINSADMHNSQLIAAAVALRASGRKVTTVENGAIVGGIVPGFPAAGKLRPTDVIVAVDGRPVRALEDLGRATAGKPIGTVFRFSVIRNGKRIVVALPTKPIRAGSKRGIVGVFGLLQNQTIHLPIKVSIEAHGVGGPSAGLAFALDVLQELGRNVDRGHKIAATGELFLNGRVGPIGGVKQKTIGAREAGVDAFLVPAGSNAAEARKYAHGLRIIPVKSFQQALHALATLPPNS
jgi:Lon-like protease